MTKLRLSRIQKALFVILFACTYFVCSNAAQAVELTVTDSMLFHYKVDDGAVDATGTQATNGVDVQTWQDQAGNSYDLSPTSAGRRPTYETNIAPNGMPGLYFNGSSDTLQRVPLDAGTNTINTLFFVFAPTNTINNSSTGQILMNASGDNEQVAVGAYTGALANEIIGTRSRQTNNVPGSYCAYATTTENISGVTILSVVHNSADRAFDLYINGTSRRNTTGGGPDDNGFRFITEPLVIGARSTASGFFGGHIFEIIAYTNVLSTTDRESVESYLNYRYFTADRTITATTSSGGEIAPAGDVPVTIAGSTNFMITADWGYHISDITINGSSINENFGINPKSYTYSWDNIEDDGTINATFAADAKTLSVTNNLGLWLTSTTGMLDPGSDSATTGDFVQVWQDQSGNGLDFSPSYESRRPLLEGNASPNGEQGLRFDGINDTVRRVITLTAASIIVAMTPADIISSTSATSHVLGGGADAYAETLQLGGFTGTFDDELFGMRSKNSSGGNIQAGYLDSSTTIDGFTIISAIRDSTANKWNLYLNSDDSKSFSVGDDTGFVISNTYLNIGASRSQTELFDGYIFEVLAYTNSLSAADRESVESYLKFKFTSPEPPPAGTIIVIK